MNLTTTRSADSVSKPFAPLYFPLLTRADCTTTP
jgi:hypothetical protein